MDLSGVVSFWRVLELAGAGWGRMDEDVMNGDEMTCLSFVVAKW